MKIGIIGCGLIGHKRAKTFGRHTLIACADLNRQAAEKLVIDYPECQVFSNWQDLLASDVDMIVIATPHNALAEIAIAACEAGKHILIEKPAARNTKELEPVILAAKQAKVLVRVGFNHRYHRAFQKAKQMVDAGDIGELMFIRARYGHGGRLGYDQEWRAKPELSGGGELIDQGVHLIDLARWFLGDFPEVSGYAHTYFWPMPVEDNGFMLLKTAKNQVAFLHASCSEWKNLFSFEIYGKKGKLEIKGLGGSYGVESFTFYKILPEMGPPETISWEFPMADNSWQVEFDEFCRDIELQRQPSPSLLDAKAALRVVETVYKESGYDYHS